MRSKVVFISNLLEMNINDHQKKDETKEKRKFESKTEYSQTWNQKKISTGLLFYERENERENWIKKNA